MSKCLALSCTVLLISASAASAQCSAPPPTCAPACQPTFLPVPMGSTCGPVAETCLPGGCSACACLCPAAPCERFWVTGEALLWWIKSAPVSVPLLSTFAPGSPSAATGFGGALRLDGTTVLSPDHLGYGPLLGGRVSVGSWLDDEGALGVEASGFLLETKPAGASVSSNGAGAPPLRVPFVNPPPGAAFPLGESSFVLASPGLASGAQSLSSSSRLWGTELNGLYRLSNSDAYRVSLVGGFRYLDLQEGLTITNVENVLGNGSFVATDEFGTRNQFYGGQLGVKAEARFERYFASFAGNVALGVDHESVTINGNTTVDNGTGPTVTSGGIFAQGTNIGRRTRNDFAVVPSAQLKMGIDVTSHVRAFIAYDFLYVSNVARPGDQIDRTLNLTQSSAITPPGALLGPPRPAPLFNSTDFWAQGVSLGMRFSW